MYQATRPSRSAFLNVRTLRYHVRQWGVEPSQATQPPLVLLHGWMDVSASWQFVVDALETGFLAGRTVLAPDWRGFGLTQNGSGDSYWFPDYLADLDALLDHYAPGQSVDLVGHSMGGDVVMMYAGVRPQRVRRLVNLEGFGMPATRAAQAPGRYAQWLNELKTFHRGELALKSYADLHGVARRLMKTNPRLPLARALWLAPHWAEERVQPDGRPTWHIRGDDAHKLTSAQLYRADETLALYQRISAPTLAVEASDDSLAAWWKGGYTLAEYHERLKSVPNARIAVIQDAGHMLHHDQPQALARLLEDFVSAP